MMLPDSGLNLGAAFMMGLLGGGHCIGMCGGIMSALTFAIPPSQRSWWRLSRLLLSYNLARILSYSLAGAFVASLGTLLSGSLLLTQVLQGLALIVLVMMALYVGQWWQGLIHLEGLGQHLWRYIEPQARRFLPVYHPGQAFVLGALWGWLPCGLVYSALIWSLSAGSAAQGALLMLAFGVGTLPTLLATGAFARRLQQGLKHPYTRTLAGLSLLLLAGWQMWHLLF